MDDQITNFNVSLGDIKASEMETCYQNVKNVIRLHNIINSIDSGTPYHFRMVSHTQKNYTPSSLFALQLNLAHK